MVEGLWSIEFGSSQGIFGTGIVVFEREKVFGGDANYFNLGKYKIESNTLKVEVESTHYAGKPLSVVDSGAKLRFAFEGTADARIMYCKGHLASDPSIKDLMGLVSLKDEKAGNLPHGHQRALGVSKALACRPSLLLQDEPITGRNPTKQRRWWKRSGRFATRARP